MNTVVLVNATIFLKSIYSFCTILAFCCTVAAVYFTMPDLLGLFLQFIAFVVLCAP